MPTVIRKDLRRTPGIEEALDVLIDIGRLYGRVRIFPRPVQYVEVDYEAHYQPIESIAFIGIPRDLGTLRRKLKMCFDQFLLEPREQSVFNVRRLTPLEASRYGRGIPGLNVSLDLYLQWQYMDPIIRTFGDTWSSIAGYEHQLKR